MTDGSTTGEPPTDIHPAQTPPPRASRPWRFVLLAVALTAALATLYWIDVRQRLSGAQHELAGRLRAAEEGAREAGTAARAAQDSLLASQSRIAALEARLADSQSQQLALEALYSDLTRNRDEWQLAEIEQVLAIASQQLQLAGNVRAALLALQRPAARLSRADRPQFVPVRRALARDIERLKSLPAIDFPGMSMRIDSLVASVDGLPLAYDERTERAAATRDAASQAGFWSRLGAEIWSELKQLVVVRQTSAPE